jgi:hypothetical protein
VVLLAAGDVAAQTDTMSQPQSLILPNYNRIRVGKDEALQGGAYVARAGGPAANVYNPAGLANAKTSQVAASSTGYEYLSLEIAGTTRTASSSDLVGLGSYFGFVLADPPIPLERWRFGFSISEPLDWSPPSIATVIEGQSSDPAQELRLTAQSSLGSFIPAFAVGFAATDDVRFGLSISLPRISFNQAVGVSIRSTTASATQVDLRNFSASGDSKQVRAAIGAQWDVVPALTLGLVATTPGVVWSSGGKLSGQGGSYTGTSLVDNRFLDTSADFTYKLPFQLEGGVAVRFDRFAFEADVRWYAAVSDFSLFASQTTGTRTVTSPLGIPTSSPLAFAPSVVSWGDVVNVAAGGQWDVSDKVRIQLGFFTDRSPVQDGAVFPKTDLYGGTAGASFVIGKLFAGSLGASYTSGTSARTVLGRLPDGTAVESEVRLTILQLLYSVELSFGGP